MTFYTFTYYYRKLILYFLFPIPHKEIFKDFAYILGIVDLRNNSLLIRTVSITCTIPCQRRIVPKLILIGVILGGSLRENSCTESFYKT